MDKLGDMDLFMRVIKSGGLAAAGREVGLSPARITARMNALEKRYGVRLLNRTTQRVSLTDGGREFYAGCEQSWLKSSRQKLGCRPVRSRLLARYA